MWVAPRTHATLRRAHLKWLCSCGNLCAVRELPLSVLKKLDLKAAAQAEAAFWRNLLPPEPWAIEVAANAGAVAKWVYTRLEAGHRNAPGLVVDARKAHQAFRPVPVVGIAERIAFRALTEWVVADIELSDVRPRSTGASWQAPSSTRIPRSTLG